MRKIARRKLGRKAEVRVTPAVATALMEMDARVEMIQALIPLGLEAVEQELQRGVVELAGPRYVRGPMDRRYYRWGSEQGSVYLADQKVAVRVPRVRDVHEGREIRLPSYEMLQTPRGLDAHLLGRVIRGLGMSELSRDLGAGSGGLRPLGLERVSAVHPCEFGPAAGAHGAGSLGTRPGGAVRGREELRR